MWGHWIDTISIGASPIQGFIVAVVGGVVG